MNNNFALTNPLDLSVYCIKCFSQFKQLYVDIQAIAINQRKRQKITAPAWGL